MIASEYRDIFLENSKQNLLPEGMGILTMKEYTNRYSEEIQNRLDFIDVKEYFRGICNRLLENKVLILKKIYNLLSDSKNIELSEIFLEKDQNFEDYSIQDIENILYKVGEAKFSDDKLIYDLYIDYLGYGNLIKEAKKSLFNGVFNEIKKYVFSESGKLLDSREKDELVGEIIDDIENKFENIDLSDKYLFEKIYKIITTIKLNFIVAGNLFKKVKGEEITNLYDLEKIGIEFERIISNNLNEKQKEELLEELMELYYKNYNEKTQKDFLYEIKAKLEKMILDDNNSEVFYLFKIDGKLALSLYFEEIDNETLYMGGFNSNNIFFEYGFGFWVLEKILEEKKDKTIKAGVLTSVDGFKKWGYERIIKKYRNKPFGFKVGGKKQFGDNNEYIEIIKYPKKY